MIWVALALSIWLFVSCVHFWNTVGRKNKKVSKLQNFVDGVLLLPLLTIAPIIGWLRHR